jgi:hypothetical protein
MTRSGRPELPSRRESCLSATERHGNSGRELSRSIQAVTWAHGPDARRRLAWAAAGIIIVAVTWWAMDREMAAARHPTVILAGQDFWNNTWWAVRAVLSGANIYGPTHAVIPGIEPAWPVGPHVPDSLLWQAPFAALPIPLALFAFTFVSIIAIWAGVFMLTRPTEPWAVLGSAACGTFAIGIGGGPETLLLGQPTGFILLGLATVVRSRRPWLAGAGFLFAATTLQTGLPLALALLVLNGWPVLWRGVMLILACSAPTVGLAIASSGLGGFVTSYVSGAAVHLGRQGNRIDLGALLRELGVANVGLRVAAGLAVAAICLGYLASLPRQQRRIDNPPVLCMVICATLLCTYHQYYDMLLVGAGVVPVILIVDRSWPMLPSLGLAAIGAATSTYSFRDVAVPLCLAGVAAGSARALRSASRSDQPLTGTTCQRPPLRFRLLPLSWPGPESPT